MGCLLGQMLAVSPRGAEPFRAVASLFVKSSVNGDSGRVMEGLFAQLLPIFPRGVPGLTPVSIFAD